MDSNISDYLKKYTKFVSREAVIRERMSSYLRERYDIIVSPRDISVGARAAYVRRVPSTIKGLIAKHSDDVCAYINKNEHGFIIDRVG